MQAIHDRITNDFTYHPPKTKFTSDTYARFRTQFRMLAHDIVDMTPEGREQALALTKLEEAVFWVNASIARNEDGFLDKHGVSDFAGTEENPDGGVDLGEVARG